MPEVFVENAPYNVCSAGRAVFLDPLTDTGGMYEKEQQFEQGFAVGGEGHSMIVGWSLPSLF